MHRRVQLMGGKKQTKIDPESQSVKETPLEHDHVTESDLERLENAEHGHLLKLENDIDKIDRELSDHISKQLNISRPVSNMVGDTGNVVDEVEKKVKAETSAVLSYVRKPTETILLRDLVLKNTSFQHVVKTESHTQLIIMKLGHFTTESDRSSSFDTFLYVEKGVVEIMIDNVEMQTLHEGSATIIPVGYFYRMRAIDPQSEQHSENQFQSEKVTANLYLIVSPPTHATDFLQIQNPTVVPDVFTSGAPVVGDVDTFSKKENIVNVNNVDLQGIETNVRILSELEKLSPVVNAVSENKTTPSKGAQTSHKTSSKVESYANLERSDQASDTSTNTDNDMERKYTTTFFQDTNSKK